MEQPTHKLSLSDRQKLSVTGVEEVVSFDDTGILLHTVLGTLTIQGKDLHLRNLSLEGGEIQVDGTVSGLYYEEPRAPGWLGRFFG